MNRFIAGGVDIGNSFFGGSHFLDDFGGVSQLVSIGVGDAMVVAGVVLVIMIIIGGYGYISGAGDPSKTRQAQNILTYAVIGFILVIAAFFIVYIIETSTGIPILSFAGNDNIKFPQYI